MARARRLGSCTLNVGDTYHNGYLSTFNFNRGGWGSAKAAAMKLAKDTGHLALVDVKCKGGVIPLYQCDRRSDGVSCVVESGHRDEFESEASIAGARRRRRR